MSHKHYSLHPNFLTIFTTIATQFRGLFQHGTSAQDLQTDNLEFIPTHSSGVQWAEDISNSPSAPLNVSPNNNHCWVKQELHCLWMMFTSWLQPEKQSKKQMISQLVLKQFLLTELYKDEFALTEKWKSSGRDMRRFMESLTDECLKPPVMVHVSMQGKEGLFSENMPLKEVIKLLKQQQSATRPTPKNARMPVDNTRYIVDQRLVDCLLSKGQENSENECDSSWNFPEVNTGDNCTGNEMNSLLIIQKEQDPEQEERCVFLQFSQGTGRASQGNSSHHVKFLGAPTTVDVSMEPESIDLFRTANSVDRKDWNNSSSNASQENNGNNIPRNKMDSFFSNQRVYPSEPDIGDASCEVIQDYTRTNQGNSTWLQESLGESFPEEDPRDLPGFLSRPVPPTSEPALSQNHEANLTCESHQERYYGDPKPYTCEQCPRRFKYACHLSSYLRTHLNKRALSSDTRGKIFKGVSDLQIHEIIHMPEKPFIFSTCKRSFSHKMNLKAHERIHTGEKPYACSLCTLSFRQSSTYHHMRNYHKSDLTI
ncbi:zinc finger and SCAN domain containing protein 4C-like [Apodemus sylvaticus]|uniref:zinc finger and SCAN domain containing protein 4C-like n=1 Tax=Apodemus sylvaticus TaxID=10129 RepID=UPI002242344A|nr:zinc finger and SCAN domain containing protein 4C-like [Apodemus sylvaticus]